MADHTDDTILDDELDENDFNFDNENEDDLLAENEYDDFIDKSEQQTVPEIRNRSALPPSKTQQKDETEELVEPEEDVLDIGIVEEDTVIVEEDVVDSESICTAETIVYVNRNECSVQSPISEPPEYEEKAGNPAEETVEATEHTDTSFENENDKSFVQEALSSSVEEDEKREEQSVSRHSNDKENDKSSKSKFISLRKPDRKSYDDVPDLAKVIVLQPGSTASRNRKTGRAADSYNRKRRDTADSSNLKHNHDYDDRRRKESSRYDRDRDSDWERDRDRDRDRDRERGRSYSYREEYSFSSDEGSNSQLVISRDAPYYEGNENYRDPVPGTYDYQQAGPMDLPHEPHFQPAYQNTVQQYQPDRSVITSVQITQERYQITSDFHVIRPSMPPPHIVPRPPPPNAYAPAPNRPPFLRPPHPESMQHPYPNAVRPPPNVRMMPPQQMPFHGDMNARPPPPQGFRPGLPPMGQRLPPPHLAPRGPPMNHLQRPPFPGPPPQPQMQPPPMNRPGLPPPQMRPQFRPPPQQQMQPPPPHPNMQRPPMMGMPPQNEHPPPQIMAPRQPQHMLQMPPPQNVFHPPENGAPGMLPPPFRPNVPPPQAVMQRPHEQPPPQPAPQPVEYFDKPRQFVQNAPPPNAYQPCVNQPPPFAGRPPGQPPPPGVPPSQPMRNAYMELEPKPEMNYSAYPSNNYYANQPPQEYTDYQPSNDQYMNNDGAMNHLKRGNSSIDDSPVKQPRYEKDDDDDMKMYREKVEYQKKLREKFVQMKEEQRLKNQMQSFIQNNIKGILEKREQFRRKNELEIAKQARESTKRIEAMPTDDYRRESSSTYSSSEHRSQKAISPPPRRYEEPVRPKEVAPKEKPKPAAVARNNNQVNIQRSEKTNKHNDVELESDRRQLHKVVKITYKDGTVALKSIPVRSTGGVITKPNTTVPRKIHSSDNLNVTIGRDDSGNANSNRRRMVISKQIPLPNVKNILNENVIVESVRKGVTQSSVPLAQRFSNLRTGSKEDEDEEMLTAAKSKNRLVIPDEDGSRTVLIKNITPGTNPALIQKMASTCGTVSRTKWITGGAQSTNQAKITFGKSEEAKKFCLNFHRKMIDSSLISVSVMSEGR